jgi:membrane protein YqaA with SNARE-associated domain
LKSSGSFCSLSQGVRVLTWLFVALGVAFGSALLPLISIEIFLVGLALQEPSIPWLLLGAVVAIGQVGGKLFYYYAAKGQLHLPRWLHRRREPGPPSARRIRWELRTKRLRGWVAAMREKCHRHPRWMVGAYGLSSVFGLPPFMATSVLAGMVRMSLSAFLGAGLLGRFIRFSAIAASPALVAGWIL